MQWVTLMPHIDICTWAEIYIENRDHLHDIVLFDSILAISSGYKRPNEYSKR